MNDARSSRQESNHCPYTTKYRSSSPEPLKPTILPCTNRSGGQSALRFSRLATAARHEWVKKVSTAMNSHFVHGGAVVPSRVLVCGGGGLKALLCGTSDVHYSLRPMLWSCPSNIDPSSRLDQRLRKVSVSADSGAKVRDAGAG